jgi:hypothetical protein
VDLELPALVDGVVGPENERVLRIKRDLSMAIAHHQIVHNMN